MAAPKSSQPPIWKRESLAMLAGERCPVCVRLLREIPRHFFWFVNDHYYEVECIVELRRSYGFCPAHTADLLATGSSSVITTVFGWLAQYAIDRLGVAGAVLGRAKNGDGQVACRKAADLLRPQGSCRACRDLDWQANHVITALLHSMTDPDVRRAYESSSGFCLPHFRQAGGRASWDTLLFLARQMQERLRTTKPGQAGVGHLEIAAGLDSRIAMRKSFRDGDAAGACALRGDHADDWSPSLEWMLARMREPGCPVCNERDRGLQRYFHWLGQELKSVVPAEDQWDTSWRVCPSHFWQLRGSGQERAAARIAERVGLEWLWRLDDLISAVASRPAQSLTGRIVGAVGPGGRQPVSAKKNAPGMWQRLADALERPEHRLERLRAAAFRMNGCEACAHVRAISDRTLDLLLRVLEQPDGREAYGRSHGLCLRHCFAAATMADNAAALAPLIAAQLARLRLLHWELEEASRKLSWSVRYEAGGPERGAWRRAARQFCGLSLDEG